MSKLTYIGGPRGSFLPGVPRQNLSAAEVQQHGQALCDALLENAEAVQDPKARGQAVVEAKKLKPDTALIGTRLYAMAKPDSKETD